MSFTQPGYPSGPGSLGALSDTPEEEGKEPKKDKKVTSRIVNRQVVIAAVFALLVVAAGAFLMLGTASSSYVAVASTDIAAGSKVTPDKVSAVAVAKDEVVPGAFVAKSKDAAISDATKALSGGSRTNQTILKNAQISVAMLGASKPLAEDLAPNERLMSVKAAVSRSVAAQITPGDKVDVIGTVDGTTKVLAHNVPVIATLISEDKLSSQETNTDDATAGDPSKLVTVATVPGLFVLRVDMAQMLPIVAAGETGNITLVWNPPDAASPPSAPVSGTQAVQVG